MTNGTYMSAYAIPSPYFSPFSFLTIFLDGNSGEWLDEHGAADGDGNLSGRWSDGGCAEVGGQTTAEVPPLVNPRCRPNLAGEEAARVHTSSSRRIHATIRVGEEAAESTRAPHPHPPAITRRRPNPAG